MNRNEVETWLKGYRSAWRTDDPARISALFTEDASYSPYPFGGAWLGHAAIIRGWTGHHDSAKDWTFEHEILAVDGNTAVVHGETHYPASGDTPEADFSNIWVIDFAPDGRAVRFREWWVERPTDEDRGR